MVKIERSLRKFLEAELLRCGTDEKVFLDCSPWSSLDGVLLCFGKPCDGSVEMDTFSKLHFNSSPLIGEDSFTKVWKTLGASHEPCHSAR